MSDSSWTVRDILQRVKFASTLGVLFEGLRSIPEALGYVKAPSFKHFHDLYISDGIANRVVSWGPSAVWSNGVGIQDSDDEEPTPFSQEVESLFKALKFVPIITKADILASLGEYSVVFLGFNDVTSEAEWAQPVNQGAQLVYLRPIAQNQALLGAPIDDLANPLHGHPSTYNITFIASTGLKASRAIHYSRVLHIAKNTLDDPVRGLPYLRPVFNYFTDLMKLVGGGAEGSWQNVAGGTQFDLDPLANLSEPEMEELDEEIKAYKEGLQSYLRTRGVKMNKLPINVHTFERNVMTVLRLIAGYAQIPMRQLIGSEAAELASTQDRETKKENVWGWRQGYAEEVVRSLIDRLIEFGSFANQPTDGEYSVVWPEMEDMTLSERVDVTARAAKANYDNSRAGGGPVVTADEMRANYLNMDPLDVPDVVPSASDNEPGTVQEEIQ